MISDRFLSAMLYLSTLALIAISGGCTLLFTCHGLFDLLDGEWKQAIGHLILGMILGFGSYVLCRNANDLMDRRTNL